MQACTYSYFKESTFSSFTYLLYASVPMLKVAVLANKKHPENESQKSKQHTEAKAQDNLDVHADKLLQCHISP